MNMFLWFGLVGLSIGMGMIIIGLVSYIGILNGQIKTSINYQKSQIKGIVDLQIKGVNNPLIVETIMNAFDDAVVTCTQFSEIKNGEVELHFAVNDSALTQELRGKLKEAGFLVSPH